MRISAWLAPLAEFEGLRYSKPNWVTPPWEALRPQVKSDCLKSWAMRANMIEQT